MDLQELSYRMGYYMYNYEPFTYVHNVGQTQFVDIDLTDKVCRFCGKRYPDVKFKKKAHAISELAGNKEFVLRNECDFCNGFFGQKLEDEFSKYLGLGRTLSQIHAKDGVPSYKSRDGKTRIDFTNKGLVIQDTEGSKNIEHHENHILFHSVRDTYTPVAVYKALVKMALSLLPYKQMPFFFDTVNWLKEDSHLISKYDMGSYQHMIERYVPGPMTLQMRATGFIRKSNVKNLPYYIFYLEFANYSFQIMVPCVCKDELFSVKVIPVPGADETGGPSYGTSKIKFVDLSKKTKVKDEPIDLCLGYQTAERYDAAGITIDELLNKEGIILKKRLDINEK